MVDQNLLDSQIEDNSFKKVFFKYLGIWPWFLLSLVIAISCAFIYLRYAVPQYSINATLLIKDDKKGGDLTDAASAINLDIFKSSQSINNEMEVLKSKRLMQKVLSELSLQTTCYAVGTIKTTEVYGKTLPIRLLATRIDSTAYTKALTFTSLNNNIFEINDGAQTLKYRFGQQVNLPYAAFTIVSTSPPTNGKSYLLKFNDLRKLGLYYDDKLSLNLVNKDATVLSLSLIDAVPQKAQDILNKLVDEYNQEAIEDKNLLAQNTVGFIDQRLKYLLNELTGVEKNVESYKKANQVVDLSADAQIYINQSSEYSKKANDLAIQVSVLNSIESYLNKQENRYSLVPSSLGIEDPTLNGLIEKFNQLQLERNRIMRTVQDISPLVTSVNDQLNNLRVNILENLKNIRQGLLIAQSNLDKNLGTFKSKINSVPTVERGLSDIKRTQLIKENIYAFLLQKREEASISLASAVSNSRIIDRAYYDDAPIKPQKALIYLLSFIIGVLIPIAIMFIVDFVNIKVKSIDDITKAVDVSILGELSHNDSKETLVVRTQNRSEMAERFRLIRSNLQFTAKGSENRVLMVTSSRSGEGKTFFSINFAASLALTGKKVALLEFDIRNPRVLKDLNMSPFPAGITNYLVDANLTVKGIAHELPDMPGLSIISAGPIPPNPSELLLSPRLEELINEIKLSFDFIVIDTSPIGQVSDAFTLGKFASSSIYIVRHNYTYKEQLNIVKDIRRNGKMNNLLIVLNDVKKGGGGGYGYGYGYGGYGVEIEKKSPWKKNIFKKK